MSNLAKSQPKTSDLPPVQRLILLAIVEYQRKHGGKSPAFYELAEQFSKSRTAVAKNVDELCKRDLVTLERRKPRSITVLPLGKRIARQAVKEPVAA